ncbi:hypothetical protein ANTPLA_LOCUS4733 [Anthophora plagiata]
MRKGIIDLITSNTWTAEILRTTLTRFNRRTAFTLLNELIALIVNHFHVDRLKQIKAGVLSFSKEVRLV